MDTQDKHQLWELNVEGFDTPMLASKLVAYMSSGLDSAEVSQALIKSHIAISSSRGKAYVRCGTCGCPLQYVAANATRAAYFRHDIHKAVSQEQTKVCFFYSGSESFFGPGDIYKGEGQWHFYHKHWLAAYLEQAGYQNIAVEQFLFSKDPELNARRRPDIYFCDNNGQRFAIELTRWWMSPETIAERELFFREQGINLIWLFSPDCETNNNTTLNVILYGSAATRDSSQQEYVLSKVECNVFILSPEAMKMTRESGVLTFEILYPLAEFIDGDISINKQSSFQDITQLNLAPSERLPYVIPTSHSFLTALAAKEKDQRSTTARQLTRLRQLALNNLWVTKQGDIDYYQDALRYCLGNLVSYPNRTTIGRYAVLANSNIARAAELYSQRAKRRDRAQAIGIFRNGINDTVRMAATAANLSTVMTALERLNNIKKRAGVYPSKPLQNRLEGAERKIRRLLSLFRQKDAEKRSKELQAKQYLVDEMNGFIEELSAGFSGVVEDKDALRLKGQRISSWAKRHGLHEEAEIIKALLESAIENADQAYLKEHYPLLSSGYRESARYKPELDKAFARLSETDVHIREKSYKRQQARKQCTQGLLVRFRKEIDIKIEQDFERLITGEPATLSSFISSQHQAVNRLVMLVTFLNENGITFSQDIIGKLNTTDETVKAVLSGQDINTAHRQLRLASTIE